jgi:hypothetical protein
MNHASHGLSARKEGRKEGRQIVVAGLLVLITKRNRLSLSATPPMGGREGEGEGEGEGKGEVKRDA